ncbi:hypothetical protein HS088_TW15G00752 [Tripterygium wilfordii]|uniref:Uncharacterized protein n=1 Tax=Tripterygium wilfordii TaxID=458696 RepID=A0A7J7CMJ1_TRIWF|nr:hypothetical protein HS088_TW15G00752 [Tripterygium wilfordii]
MDGATSCQRQLFYDWLCCWWYNKCILWVQPCRINQEYIVCVARKLYTFLHKRCQTKRLDNFTNLVQTVPEWNHTVMPIIRKWVKGPMWLHFLIGAPPVIVFSTACAGLAGGAVPALAQLASSAYHVAVSSHSLPPSSQDEKIQNSRISSTL